MSDTPLDCVGVPADGVGKHDFQFHIAKDGPHLFGTLSDVSGLVVTANSEPEVSREAIIGLKALYLDQRERNAVLQARLDAILATLTPVCEQDWHGKLRVNRAIELARG